MREETQTLATITIQNYFRMYEKLAGMTGTAETEETEFFQIYKLEVVVIPTNRPVRRIDKHDLIYKTRREKYNAIVEEIGAAAQARATGAGGHGQRGGLGDALAHAEASRHPARGAERQVPPARGRDRRAGGPAGRDHDRDQHGGPRHRHQAGSRRQEVSGLRHHDPARARVRPGGRERAISARRDQGARLLRRSAVRSGDRRDRAARGPAHRPPAAGPLRAPGRSGTERLLSCRWKTI